ncbi:MAG: 30S ribosomal protein S11 [Elusimicrobia bacterium CG_4_10_14_0_2_um_filter_56_8]|nr:MAG: 30S ribosomal protein S11 [Elusimicrobia bacterium CG1_02_56_21]PJA11834.1 MAG: 30S ribosomal protein S11 [Elusimicrobia bacterium CG_4_10_14_0_2_um_filter_56_8]
MADETKKQQNGAKKPEQKVQARRRYRTVAFARVYINCSFNNTMVTFTDEKGGVISWATSGGNGFRGTKKGTPFAAQITAAKAAAKAGDYGVRQAMVFVNGPGPGRETAIRAVAQSGIHVVSIKDITPIPHNGCRPPKARRV